MLHLTLLSQVSWWWSVLRADISDEPFFPGVWAGKCAWSSPRRDHFWGNRFPSARLTPLHFFGLLGWGIGFRRCKRLPGVVWPRDKKRYMDLSWAQERKGKGKGEMRLELHYRAWTNFNLLGHRRKKTGKSCGWFSERNRKTCLRHMLEHLHIRA